MQHSYPALLLLGMLSATTVLAQEPPAEEAHPCTAIPLFHCVERLDDGSAVAHFGYDLQCPQGEEPVPDLTVPIGEDNHFSPDPADRGQPVLFMPGRHADEFEAEFTAEEIKQAKDVHWMVNRISARVDFTRTKDAELDCTALTY